MLDLRSSISTSIRDRSSYVMAEDDLGSLGAAALTAGTVRQHDDHGAALGDDVQAVLFG